MQMFAENQENRFFLKGKSPGRKKAKKEQNEWKWKIKIRIQCCSADLEQILNI